LTGHKLGVEDATCEVEEAVVEAVIEAAGKAIVVVAVVVAKSKESECAKYSIFLS
jgi:hypothetical protein